MDAVLKVFAWIVENFELVLGVIGFAALVASKTPNKSDDKIVQVFLDIVNFVAANFGTAKNSPEVGDNRTGKSSDKVGKAAAIFAVFFLAGFAAAPSHAAKCDDVDGDGVLDRIDNCTLVANSNQYDFDRDGYGNACDGDLSQNGRVDGDDFIIMRDCLRGTSSLPACDFDGDGRVTYVPDFREFHRLSRIGGSPGPRAELTQTQ